MTDLSTIKFFVTPQHNCSYLPRQDAATLFADPKATVDSELYNNLSNMGFRRSGNFLYRPHCGSCAACIPVRVPSKLFSPSKKQRRIINKNSDLTVTIKEAEFNEEHYTLYKHYIEEKHRDGDMYPPSRDQYKSFLLSEWGETKCFEFRLPDNSLVAAAISDHLDNGISAVYTFYDTRFQRRSLGAYAILWQIQRAKELNLTALYLGYWIKECRKMSYKTEYRPLEMLIDDQWEQTN